MLPNIFKDEIKSCLGQLAQSGNYCHKPLNWHQEGLTGLKSFLPGDSDVQQKVIHLPVNISCAGMKNEEETGEEGSSHCPDVRRLVLIALQQEHAGSGGLSHRARDGTRSQVRKQLLKLHMC